MKIGDKIQFPDTQGVFKIVKLNKRTAVIESWTWVGSYIIPISELNKAKVLND